MHLVDARETTTPRGRILGIEILYVLQVWTPLEETVAYQQLVGIGKKEGRQEDHGFEPAANLDFCDCRKKQNCQSLTFSVTLSGQIGSPDGGILSFIDRRVERDR